jgi:hypothetical protein
MLDRDFFARLRKKRLRSFATIAEDMERQAILLGATLPKDSGHQLEPTKAYRITWLPRKRTEEPDFSVHASPEAATSYLKSQRARSGPWNDAPENGWDKPIIREVEIIREGVIRKAISEGAGTISYRDYFVNDADGRRPYDFQKEMLRHFDYLRDLDRLKPTGETLELDLSQNTATRTYTLLGVRFQRTLALS